VVVPPSKPFRAEKTLSTFEREFAPEDSNGSDSGSGKVPGNPYESTDLSLLKELIASGEHRLDPMLAMIADSARQLTGASGAALAMWKDGAMVCRARSGEAAPALGARLNADTGISGECLRTSKIQNCADTENDPHADLEVCRSLGLRSIAVLPIHGWRGINGILEVFSTAPVAFNEQQIAILQQLAVLAERARASQPHGASSSAARLASAIEKPQPTGLLPASDRVGDVALAFVGTRSRPFVLGLMGLVAFVLLIAVSWLGWRGPDEGDGRAHAASPTSANAGISSATAGSSDSRFSAEHPFENDEIWKPHPGGEAVYTSSGKPSAGSPVTFASKVGRVAPKKTRTDRSAANRSGLLPDVADKIAAAVDLPPIPSAPANEASASASAHIGVLSAKSSLPELAAPLSRGVSGGQLVRRVPPVYPAQARLERLDGTVVLAAAIMEDGSVGDVKVVEGPPMLAQSAVDAVKQWRYRPFELDGKPVKNEIRISVEFRFPSDASSR
jgi:TonB family protein